MSAADSAAPTPSATPVAEHLLEVRDLAVHFTLKRSLSDRLWRRSGRMARAVDGVSLFVDAGELVALVGESGSGKTTLALAALRLLEPTAGTVLLAGSDVTRLPRKALRSVRRRAQFVHQDPYASLDPRLRTEETIAEGLRIHRIVASKEDERARVYEALAKVGLTPPETFADRYPHQLSGGQRQRVAIAGSLVLGPSLLVADEPVSMLDVSVRAGVLELLDKLRREEGLGILMITHDLATAAHVADRVAVMYHGMLVELGPGRTVIDAPQHPYTQALIAAVPRVQRGEARIRRLPGEPPDASKVPPGCRFHPRCPLAVERCREEVPELLPARIAGDQVVVACHLRSVDGTEAYRPANALAAGRGSTAFGS
jgi:oligopeptide/dipeptide ABC transporter ATP-binding protein